MNNEIQFILYQLPEGEGKVQVVIKDETIWATQKAMAQLFDVGVSDISKHLKKKYETGELERESTISKMETVVNRGFRGEIPEQVDFYSLDAIIAVGYRVSSVRATQFRKWATKVLKEFITTDVYCSVTRRWPRTIYPRWRFVDWNVLYQAISTI